MNLDNANLYVAFDDSSSDPTYSPADSVYLVVAAPDYNGGNPCVGDGIKFSVPLLPGNVVEIEHFAEAIGWTVKYDSEGQAIIHTGISK